MVSPMVVHDEAWEDNSNPNNTKAKRNNKWLGIASLVSVAVVVAVAAVFRDDVQQVHRRLTNIDRGDDYESLTRPIDEWQQAFEEEETQSKPMEEVEIDAVDSTGFGGLTTSSDSFFNSIYRLEDNGADDEEEIVFGLTVRDLRRSRRVRELRDIKGHGRGLKSKKKKSEKEGENVILLDGGPAFAATQSKSSSKSKGAAKIGKDSSIAPSVSLEPTSTPGPTSSGKSKGKGGKGKGKSSKARGKESLAPSISLEPSSSPAPTGSGKSKSSKAKGKESLAPSISLQPSSSAAPTGSGKSKSSKSKSGKVGKSKSAKNGGVEVTATLQGLQVALVGLTAFPAATQETFNILTAEFNAAVIDGDLDGTVTNFQTTITATDFIPATRRLVGDSDRTSRNLEPAATVVYTQEMNYTTATDSTITPEDLAVFPLSEENSREEYVDVLNSSGDSNLEMVTEASSVVVPPPEPPTSPAPFIIAPMEPSSTPSSIPSEIPSFVGESNKPSISISPSTSVDSSSVPSGIPSFLPSGAPSLLDEPSVSSAPSPTDLSIAPSVSGEPSVSDQPSVSVNPTTNNQLTQRPSVSLQPSITPSSLPSTIPSTVPSQIPSTVPSQTPSQIPSTVPSQTPSQIPSVSQNPTV